MNFNPTAVTLEGAHIRLEPLRLDHAPDLFEAGRDPAVWTWLPYPPPETERAMSDWIAAALQRATHGAEIPFAIVLRETGRAIGSTRFLDIRRPDRALEIGATWIGTPWQRTAVNTEAKLLLLTHAFETLGAIRVQLKTDARNVNSQRAIERLGAVREGVLRKDRVLWNGFVRDTVYYGILDSEWPSIRERLTTRLGRG